jgi:hypothetical protein
VNQRKLFVGLAFLLCAFMLLTALPTTAVAVSPSYTFFEEGAEQPTFEEWDARWHKTDENPVSSLDYWCRQGHEFHSGTHAAYCARSGYNSHYVTTDVTQPMDVNITGLTGSFNKADQVLRYDTNEDAVMRKELVGARYYETITMTFWFYSDTGASDARQPGTGALVGYDFLNVLYYTGTSSSMMKHVLWTDSEQQAYAKTWTKVTLTVPNNSTYVAFEFVSGTTPPVGGDAPNAFEAYGVKTAPFGSTGMKEGVFVDDISVVGTDPAAEVPLTTHADPLPEYQTGRAFPVSYSDNNPVVQLNWIYLWYRESGAENWTKYKNELKPAGAFITSPISFVAPTDGTYEFFTQGVDTNGTLEKWRGAADTWTVVDTAPPESEARVVGSGQEGKYAGAATITLEGSDLTAGIERIYYRVDGSEWMSYSRAVVLTATGQHTVEYFATDMAGNTEGVKSLGLEVVSGTAGIAFPNDGKSYIERNVTVDFNVSMWSISKLEYSLDGGDYVALDVNATSVGLSNLTEGRHILTLRAEDPLRNVLVSETNFTVELAVSDIDAMANDLLGDTTMLAGIGVVAIAGAGGAIYMVKRRRK